MKVALGMVMTKVPMIDSLSLTDQDKRRLRRDVLAEYAAWVDQVSEGCDFKTEFSQEEIVYKITDILIEKLIQKGNRDNV